MIERTFDVERINALVNHPSIRPYIGGDIEAPLDLRAAVDCEDNYFLLGEFGGFSVVWTAPRVFEIHTFVLPEGRGSKALELASAGIAFMADHADMLWTRVPDGSDNVEAFTLKAGFKPAGQQVCDFGAGPVQYKLFAWRY